MIQAASHLASREKLCQAVEMERFLKVERGQRKKIIGEEFIVSGRMVSLRGTKMVCWVGYLTSVD